MQQEHENSAVSFSEVWDVISNAIATQSISPETDQAIEDAFGQAVILTTNDALAALEMAQYMVMNTNMNNSQELMINCASLIALAHSFLLLQSFHATNVYDNNIPTMQ